MNHHTKHKGDIAEIEVIRYCIEKGYIVSIPYQDYIPYDLVIDRGVGLERVQVKYAESNGEFVDVKFASRNKRSTKKYSKEEIDWLVCYDASTTRLFFIPSSVIGPNGRYIMRLRMSKPKNNRIKNIHFANEYEDF